MPETVKLSLSGIISRLHKKIAKDCKRRAHKNMIRSNV